MECLIRGVPVHFETSGEGRKIIVLHGTPLDHRAMRAVLDPILAQRHGWSPIYVDLPGHGKTPGPAWIANNDQMAEFVLDVIDEIASDGPFALVGESYGGYLARGVAYHRASALRGLFLWTPAKYPRSARKRPPRVVRTENGDIARSLASDNERGMFSLLVHQTQDAMRFMRAYIVPAADVADEAFLGRVVDSAFSFDLESRRIDVPTTIVCGRQDAVAGYVDGLDMLDTYPNATYLVADGAGHTFGFTEQLQLFSALFLDWLNAMDRAEAHLRGAGAAGFS